MTLKPLAAPIGALLLGGILAAGCGKRASGAGANAFKDAPAEIKAAWDVAWAADRLRRSRMPPVSCFNVWSVLPSRAISLPNKPCPNCNRLGADRPRRSSRPFLQRMIDL